MEIGLIIAGIIVLILFSQRWFWLLVFWLSGLASLFAMVASVIHFQILAAVGFFVLMSICWFISSIINDGYQY